jgi:uncharacterized membrane protein
MKVDWLNGSIATYGKDNLFGKISVVIDIPPPHETVIAKSQKEGAIAVLVVRVTSSAKEPGSSMYTIDGSDRTLLKIPVFELVTRKDTDPIVVLPLNSYISIHPQPNRFMFPARGKFQLAFNLIQSFLELAIIFMGAYRLRQFWHFSSGKFYFMSIGPICIMLEIVGAILRLIYTSVDPFYTYRMLPDKASIVLITISFPFTLNAGILLTFFCTQTNFFFFFFFFNIFPAPFPNFHLFFITNMFNFLQSTLHSSSFFFGTS